jgi:iron complex transport system substrate-binding protein
MAARQARLIVSVVAALAILVARTAQPLDAAPQTVRTPSSSAGNRAAVTRIVSLVPALTEMLYAIGGGSLVVGVSNYDSFPPAVKALPRVGALLDPDTERILSLQPDTVLVYASQTDLQMRFERAGIRVFAYRHGSIAEVVETFHRLGELTGHRAEATAAATRLQTGLEGVRARVRGRNRPRTLLVFERTPQTLRGVYASGGRGFLNEMLDAAGAVNVFADVPRESVQPSQETLLVRAPEVIMDVRASGLAESPDAQADRSAWKALASVPAVRNGRIYFLVGEQLVVPGPRLVEGVEMMARALHPEAFR